MKSDVALALLFGLCSSPCIRAASHRHRPWRPVAGYAHPRRAVGDATQPKELLALSCPQGRALEAELDGVRDHLVVRMWAGSRADVPDA